MKKKPKILILGAYGQSNIGDDMMLDVVLSFLRSNGFGNIVVNSSNPEDTRNMFDVVSFHTSIKKNILKALYHFLTAKIIIYGGGSLLVELRMNQMMGSRTPLYRAFLINLFSMFTNKKTIFCGVGVEEVSSKLSVQLIKLIIRTCSFCYVRDSLSYKILENYHCDMQKVSVGGELALLLGTPSRRRDRLYINSKLGIMRICILPVYRIIDFDNNYENYVKTLREYKDYYSNLGKTVEFYPMQLYRNDVNNDTRVISDILGSNVSPDMFKNHTHSDFLNYLSEFDLILSSRYHGIVSATVLNIPSISITNFKKNVGFLNDMSLPELSLTSSFSLSDITHLTDLIDRHYSEYGDLIFKNKNLLKKEVSNMLDEIVENYLKC
jgi:polysaccharide pyruvyl transferase WcaK-like protein